MTKTKTNLIAKLTLAVAVAACIPLLSASPAEAARYVRRITVRRVVRVYRPVRHRVVRYRVIRRRTIRVYRPVTRRIIRVRYRRITYR
ncbi:MAG: hypothetical protein KC503_42720 [Myxococcales bacterium]|nr:hypothetical protein [Myxococcales bacterium]